ncbi:MAG: TRAP transporter large permease [Flavobacteriales bacterium]|nr:TRAP transporter large permease [Flavobacteriales bacterium]
MEWIGVIVLVSSFIFLLGIGVPIAFSIGLSAVLTMITSMDALPALTTMAQRMATGLESFTLLAIPFFIFAGQLMNSGGIAVRLINLAKVLVGRLPGGLAFVNIMANMLFGAISGSAAASASAIGTVTHDRMTAEGYDEHFSTAVNASSATIGLIIPPSNVLIVYSLVSGGVSISALFIAGYLPGILTGLLLMGVCAYHAYTRNYPVDEKVSFKEGLATLWKALPSLLLLVIVIGGLIAGIFTATEASAVAVVYCLVLAMVYKEVKWSDLPQILLRTVGTTSIVMLLIGTSIGLSWIMSYENIPQAVTESIIHVSDNPIIILLLINLILLAIGIFMDITPAVLIFTPIFLPIVTELGMDPVHFGIVLVMNLCVGLITPPVGSVLFVACSVSNVKIEKVIKPLLPMFIAMIVALLLVTFIPAISLWLPRTFGF